MDQNGLDHICKVFKQYCDMLVSVDVNMLPVECNRLCCDMLQHSWSCSTDIHRYCWVLCPDLGCVCK